MRMKAVWMQRREARGDEQPDRRGLRHVAL